MRIASVQDIDRKLFSFHESAGYDDLTCREILGQLIRKLEIKLGHSVSANNWKFSPDGMAGDIFTEQTFAGASGFSWFGRIGVTVVGKREATVVEATFFLRACGKRIVANDGHDYLWLLYEVEPDGECDWSEPRWMKDEYGEYEHWESL